ncbi:MAG: hypothetical protein ACQKBT_10285 [Puniceicoccales bacterium]
MKHLLTSTLFCSLFFSTFSLAQAQEGEEGVNPLVLVGALSASVTSADVEFANLPSGKVIQIGENGVEILDPQDAPEVDPSTPRVMTSAVASMPEAQKKALARKLEATLDQLMNAYDDDMVSEDDVLAIVKFLSSVDLPYDEVFVDTIEQRFGPIVDDATTPVPPIFEPDDSQVTDPSDVTPTPEQVTEPIDNNNTYFAP